MTVGSWGWSGAALETHSEGSREGLAGNYFSFMEDFRERKTFVCAVRSQQFGMEGANICGSLLIAFASRAGQAQPNGRGRITGYSVLSWLYMKVA